MHSDGVAYESDLLAALYELIEQVESARDGNPDGLAVDVLSLSLGYFHEDGDTLSGELVTLLDRLSELGVIVVAAAGNFATSRPFYPAALAPRYAGGPGAPMISVGALNPNGSVALFSDEGPWVNCFATGAAVVSTFPTTSVGGLQPEYSVNSGRRQALDGDDFTDGFAVWSGTSFAAPAVAGLLAAGLERNAAADANLSLDGATAADAIKRAQAAVAELGT
jgi:subtilisin family serine protease